MLDKPLEQISSEDIDYLVQNNVLERRTLEYKAQLPDNSDSGKKEFLADVSSFANTIGGNLIIGIKETDGVIESNYGISLSNIDSEIARLENIIRDGISPRINVEIKAIDVNKNKTVLILRQFSSLEAPHRVIFKSHDKFYGRNSNGKYPLDVLELRTAFAQTSSIVDKIKDFRTERILKIKSGEHLTETDEHPFFALHIIPLSAFNSLFKIDANQLLQVKHNQINPSLKPIYAGGWSYRVNLSGVMAYSMRREDVSIQTYSQLYREGTIEAYNSSIFKGRDENKQLPMYALEKELINFSKDTLELLQKLGFQPPFYLFLSLINIKGYQVIVPRNYVFTDEEPIPENDLILPEIIINNFSENLDYKFKPLFDMIWNASGIEQSLNFDENGNFIRK